MTQDEMTGVPSKELSALAEAINDNLRRVAGAFENVFAYAQNAGKLLVEVKEKVPHGAFLPWIDRNLDCTQRTARRYMQVYEQREQLKTDNVSVLSEAYRFLAGDKRQHEAMARRGAELAEIQAEHERWQKEHGDDFQRRNNPKERQERILKSVLSDLFGNGGDPERWQLGDPKQDENQSDLFAGLSRYFDSFPNPDRRLAAIHNVMIWLRSLGNEQHVKKGKESAA